MKRVFDLVVATGLLVAFAPLLLLVALLIRIFLGSPILFLQVRPGLNMKPFTIFKFRTMKDIRNDEGELLPDELRLTPFGNIIRKFSLDEFPQLLNVVKGEMSLIGPRPLLMQYLPYYTEREKLRFSVRPGMTGLAQISGRNTLGWNSLLEHDVHYVENWSFALDMKIFFRTIVKVIRQDDIMIVTSMAKADLNRERSMKQQP